MAQSEITKQYKTKYTICKLMSIVITLSPLIYYLIVGMSIGEPTKRVILAFSAVAAMVLTFVSLAFKFRIRSTIFILMLGIHCCIDNITTLIMVMAATTLIDELLLTPLCKHFREKYSINKEIDKRL